MSLIARRLEKRAVSFSENLLDLIRAHGLPRYVAGQDVTTTTSRRVMAVWRCQHALADMISGLPIQQFRRVGRDRREEIDRSPFVESPSRNVDGSEEWRYQLVLSGTSRGNGYGLITEFDPSMRFARRAEILDPEEVTVEQRGGALAPPRYFVGRNEVDPARIMHLRAYGPAPGSVLGLSPIDHAAWGIGYALASRQYAGRWYEKGGVPIGLYSSDVDLDPGDIEAIKERHRIAVEEDGVVVTGKTFTYQALQPTPEQAAFLESMSATAIDIAGYFGLPPELLGYATEGSSVTYANREQRALDLLVFTVQWWIGRIERLISRQLPANEFVKINVDALLRSDLLTRYKAHDLKIRGGWGSVNEVRSIEDQDSIGPDGDEFLWPPYTTAPQPGE